MPKEDKTNITLAICLNFEFLPFANDMDKSVSKNMSINLSGKYGEKLLDHAKQPATDAFKTASKRAIQKKAESTCSLIGIKIANKIIIVSKKLQQKTVTNEHEKKIPKVKISRRKAKILLMN